MADDLGAIRRTGRPDQREMTSGLGGRRQDADSGPASGASVEKTGSAIEDTGATLSDRESLAELIVGSGFAFHPMRVDCRQCQDARATANAILAAGWRPPLPKMDADSLRSRVGALIDELAFHDDDRGKALEVAQALIDGGWLARSGAFGDPEPVAHTLRRVIQDLETEAMFRDPVRMIGAYQERSADDIIGARALSEYADRLRKHPALTGEPSPLPAEESAAEVVAKLAALFVQTNRPHMADYLAKVSGALTTGGEWPVLEPKPGSPLPVGDSVTLPLSLGNLRQLVVDTEEWFRAKVDMTGASESVRAAAEAGEDLLQRWLSLRLAMPGGPFASSPLPDSETEWGWRPDPMVPDDAIPVESEAAARQRVGAARGRALMQRRKAGPWTAVTES